MCRCGALRAQKIVKRDLVMSANAITKIVKQLDDSPRLLRGPVVWEKEGDAALAAGRQGPGIHDFDLRRCRTFCSERSRASFRR